MSGPLHTPPHKAQHYDGLEQYAAESLDGAYRSSRMLGWLLLIAAVVIVNVLWYFW